MKAERRWRSWRPAAGPLFGLAAVLALFAVDPELRAIFFSGSNAKLVLTQTVIVAVGALGMTLVIVSGGIDLSAGSVVALTGVVAASLLAAAVPPVLVVILTLAAGALIGFVNGSIIAWGRMIPFIVTLGMMGVARGLAKWLGNNQTVNPADNSLNLLMEPRQPLQFFPLPPGVWLAAGLAAAMAVVMSRTIFGRQVFAIGSNEEAARLCGIPVRRRKIAIYALAGLFFGMSGLLQYSRLTQGDPTVAFGLELEIIAAVVIGGASLNGGSGSIVGSVIGALIMAVLKSGSGQLNWPTYMQEIVIGAVIVLAVGLDRLREWRTGR